MSEPSDELFRYLEHDMLGDRAVAIVKDLREMFTRYMIDLGPKAAQDKLDALMDAQPGLDPVPAAMTAHTYVIADGILTALAVYLARLERH